MKPSTGSIVSLRDSESATELVSGSAASIMLADVCEGLSKPNRELKCKYFYDRRGSQLFDQICELDEYYLTRSEAQIMIEHADAIGRCLGDQAVVVEYGSGSSTKTRLLLDHLSNARAYLPVDISESHLLQTAAQLRSDYPILDIHPIVADFTRDFEIPEAYRDSALTVYFPGSTIGNLTTAAAVHLLRRIAEQCGCHGGLLIGFDLKKDREVLQAAYDDSQGVTAKFNLNLLHRINRELAANFDVDQFAHLVVYDEDQSRIEIYLQSIRNQTVTIADREFQFRKGERILTEYSHKYTLNGFAELASQAGLKAEQAWTTSEDYFAVMYLSAE